MINHLLNRVCQVTPRTSARDSSGGIYKTNGSPVTENCRVSQVSATETHKLGARKIEADYKVFLRWEALVNRGDYITMQDSLEPSGDLEIVMIDINSVSGSFRKVFVKHEQRSS
ncbi:MAG: hypothetical protein KAS32_25125 [Candidatus Peribacteraceae bacterium]|nr:hypothetical protein [Candidatus Peribacteraceae bacterium]